MHGNHSTIYILKVTKNSVMLQDITYKRSVNSIFMCQKDLTKKEIKEELQFKQLQKPKQKLRLNLTREIKALENENYKTQSKVNTIKIHGTILYVHGLKELIF